MEAKIESMPLKSPTSRETEALAPQPSEAKSWLVEYFNGHPALRAFMERLKAQMEELNQTREALRVSERVLKDMRRRRPPKLGWMDAERPDRISFEGKLLSILERYKKEFLERDVAFRLEYGKKPASKREEHENAINAIAERMFRSMVEQILSNQNMGVYAYDPGRRQWIIAESIRTLAQIKRVKNPVKLREGEVLTEKILERIEQKFSQQGNFCFLNL